MEKEEETSFRKLATIQKITNITPIEGADKIAVAHVLGWEVVIRKEEFNVGDLCVYVETDSIMPALPEFEFLKERKYRVRLIRLRKQVSQGLCLPLSVLPKKSFGSYREGNDVTEALGVVKYDPEAAKEARLQAIQDSVHKNRIDKFLKRYAWYRRFFTKAGRRGWPKFIKKTDEERIQRIPNICEREKGTIFTATEKLDGQSATYSLLKLKRRFWHFKQQYQFIVCSRNIHLKTPNNSSYWTIAKQINVENILKQLIFDNDEFIVLQGEIIGEGIQNNKYKIKGYDFYAFNLIHSLTGLDDYTTMEHDLNPHNVKCVPLVTNNFILNEDISKCVEASKGKSVLQKIHREGLVLRNYQKGISFKIINPDFLLQYQDEIIEEE